MPIPDAEQSLCTEDIHELAKHSVILRLERNPEDAFRSASQMFPWLQKENFLEGVHKQEHTWQRTAQMVIAFEDLLSSGKLHALLSELSKKTGAKRTGRLNLPPPKSKRFTIYTTKAMTRILGPGSPRINTGIRLGRSS
jgi:hypothetical protein